MEVLGDTTDPGMEIEIALRKHGAAARVFSAAAQRQARGCPTKCGPRTARAAPISRDLPLVTIDGETRATSTTPSIASRTGDGFRLIVAIADVSHYVRDGDALDADALERSTSVYFPRRVIPMLPEKLSNELCSLKPDVDRLCMVCDMAIDRARRRSRRTSSIPA